MKYLISFELNDILGMRRYNCALFEPRMFQ